MIVRLLNQQSLVRKASCVTFSRDGGCVLVADKNGDVYSVTSARGKEGEEAGPRLMLGHLSQLLDMAVTRDGARLLTADRDEKIRVSMFPDCFNIDNFCLGHTEFVTSIALSSSDQTRLVSGSGDGTIRCWDLTSAEERGCHDVTEDLSEADRDCHENNSAMEVGDEEENSVKRVSPPAQPAVVKLRSVTHNDNHLIRILKPYTPEPTFRVSNH